MLSRMSVGNANAGNGEPWDFSFQCQRSMELEQALMNSVSLCSDAH